MKLRRFENESLVTSLLLFSIYKPCPIFDVCLTCAFIITITNCCSVTIPTAASSSLFVLFCFPGKENIGENKTKQKSQWLGLLRYQETFPEDS